MPLSREGAGQWGSLKGVEVKRQREACSSPTSETLPQPSPQASTELGALGAGGFARYGASQRSVPSQDTWNSNSKEVPAPGGQKGKGH